MNETNITEGGYANSDMVKTTLPSILETYIEPVFNEHIISYSNVLSNAVDDSLPNKFNTEKGASSEWAWSERELDLMSEMNVYGGTVVSSSMYDTGIDNRQYSIFQLKPEFTGGYGGSRFTYWLKDVAFSSCFSIVAVEGTSAAGYASNLRGVRPRFLIG